MANLKESLADLRRLSEAAASSHARSEANLTRRISDLEEEKTAVSSERDDLDRRLAELKQETAEEISRLKVSMAESQSRFEVASQLATDQARQTETEHLALTTSLQEELSRVRREAEAQAAGAAEKEETLGKRLLAVEAERDVLAKDRDTLATRLAKAEQAHRQAQQEQQERAAAWEQETAHARDQVALARTDAQARLDALAEKAAKEARRVEVRHAAALARLQEKAAQLKAQRDAAVKDRAREAAALSKQLSVLEQEKVSLLSAREEVETRRRVDEERHQEALRRADERSEGLKGELAARDLLLTQLREQAESVRAALSAAEQKATALEIEKVEASARWETSVGEWQSRLEAAAVASADESRRLMATHEAALALVREEGGETRRQLAEKAQALRLAEQRAAELEIGKAQETARLEAALVERVSALEASWQSRFEAATKANEKESQKAAAAHTALAGRLRKEAEQERIRMAAEAKALEERAGVLAGRISDMDQEIAAQAQKVGDLEGRIRAQEQAHAEALHRAEQRVSELEIEKARDTARLEAARIEQVSALEAEKAEAIARLEAGEASWRSRFDAATKAAEKESRRVEAAHEALVAHLKQQEEQGRARANAEATALKQEGAACAARISEVEQEKAALAKMTHDLEGRMRAQEQAHKKALARAEEHAAALALNRAETAGLEATLVERVSTLEREKAEAVSRLQTTIDEWQSRLNAATEAATRESREVEARNAGIVARLEAEVERLKEQRDAALVRQREEAAVLAKRLSTIEDERARTLSERDELSGRVQQTEATQREALRLAEERTSVLLGENAELASRLSLAAKESQRVETLHEAEIRRVREELAREHKSLEAKAREQVKERAALTKRIKALEDDAAGQSSDRNRLEARVREADQRQRQEERVAEERLAETGNRLRSLEASLEEAVERARLSSEAAGRAAASLEAALAEKARESARHQKAAKAWEASRAILEDRIAELQSVFVGPGGHAPLPHPRPAGVVVEEDRDFSELDQSPLDARARESQETVDERGGANESYPEWEYERAYQPREDKPDKIVLRRPKGGCRAGCGRGQAYPSGVTGRGRRSAARARPLSWWREFKSSPGGDHSAE